MSYSPTVIGVREAMLNSLLSMMTAKLADFNTALSSISPAVTVSYNGQSITTVNASQFYIGDFDAIPNPATNWLWVTVEGGGKQDGTDVEYSSQASAADHKRVHYSQIRMYLNPDIFPPPSNDSTPESDQSTNRTLARARFTDWIIDDVFNTFSAQRITLASTTFQNTGDQMGECRINKGTAGITYKGFGGAQAVYSIEFIHQAIIYGAS